MNDQNPRAAISSIEKKKARLQKLGGTLALFMPHPDGLRVEVSHYPEGTDPVD